MMSPSWVVCTPSSAIPTSLKPLVMKFAKLNRLLLNNCSMVKTRYLLLIAMVLAGFLHSRYYEISHMSEMNFKRQLSESSYYNTPVIHLSGLNEFKLDNIRLYDNILLEGVVKRYSVNE